MLVFVRRVPLTARVIFSEEVLIHFSFWFSLVRSFSYTPHALRIREEFLLHAWCYFYSRGVICFIEEFVLHSSSWYYWGVSLTLLELVLVRSFFYTHNNIFYWGVSLTLLIYWRVLITLLELVLVRSFLYTADASFSEGFVLHSWC